MDARDPLAGSAPVTDSALDTPQVRAALSALGADIPRRERRTCTTYAAAVLGYLTRRVAEPADAAVARAVSAEQQYLDADAARLRDALGRLGEDDRELLTLIGWEELTPAEAAEVLGIRPGALRSRLHRARARLDAELLDRP
jgi:RNA polymerase sigma factor (sigma-70 family)